MTKPRRNFDLPTVHIDLDSAKNWVPPKAYKAGEIARRKGLPGESLIREYQAAGANVAKAIYDHPVDEPEDLRYIQRKLGMALLNTAWYVFGNSAKTSDIFMRRELKLPVVAEDDTGLSLSDETADLDAAKWRATKEGIIYRSRTGLARTAYLASVVSLQHQNELTSAEKKSEKQLGRTMGNTALTIISLEHANASLGVSDEDIQHVVMLDATQLLADARDSHKETGVHMSIAQLADPDSPLSVYWRNHAPRSGQARRALFEAQDTFGLDL